MKRLVFAVLLIAVILAAFVTGYLSSRWSTPDRPYQVPRITLDGSVAVPAFSLPPSDYMSDEAVDMLKLRAAVPMPELDPRQDIQETREGLNRMLSSTVAAMRELYPVTVKEATIAGVPVRIFLPEGGVRENERVLINLHGGAFSVCWDACSILESAPIAVRGGVKVVSVNYRMAPEARHPAAVEDVLAVYRDITGRVDASQVGIYGCSAGGGADSPGRGADR